jgi:thiaminase
MSIRKRIQYATVSAILIACCAATVTRSAGQTVKAVSPVQETDDKVKVDLYTKFVDTYKSNETASRYERQQRPKRLWRLVFTDRNFVEAFPLGKQVMAEDPDQLDSLIALGNAGYLAASAQNTKFDKEAIAYARRAIQLLESGKIPDSWTPYKGKDDTLAYLYSAVGVLQLKPTPNEAIEPLFKSAQLESELKKQPFTYYYLAQAYQLGPYAKQSADFQARFGGKDETSESKQALEKLNQVIDLMIDAYARAVALAGNDPQYAQSKTAWLGTLTRFYKFRHQDSDAGLSEMIAGVVSKPLPAKP